jgi:hypothetical protein
MAVTHKKTFGIYHWDTFENTTLLIDESDTLAGAEIKVKEKYGDRIKADGADRVDIVNEQGDVVMKFNVC